MLLCVAEGSRCSFVKGIHINKSVIIGTVQKLKVFFSHDLIDPLIRVAILVHEQHVVVVVHARDVFLLLLFLTLENWLLNKGFTVHVELDLR